MSTDGLREALDAHEWRVGWRDEKDRPVWGCSCGWRSEANTSFVVWADHREQAVRAALAATPPASAERDAVVEAAKAAVDAIAVDEGWPETVANVVKAEIALSKAVDALRAAEARDEH
jgi:hypothetical protein